jgi:hypothetical protein
MVLPCGWTLCETHLLNEKFIKKCSQCDKCHKYEKNESKFTVNRSVLNFILYEKQKEKRNKILKKIQNFKEISKSPRQYILNLFDSLIVDVKERKNKSVSRLEKHFDSLIDCLYEIRAKFLEDYNENSNREMQNFDLSAFELDLGIFEREKYDERMDI